MRDKKNTQKGKKKSKDLIECQKCHHQISKAARTCPDCGHPIGVTSWLLESKLSLIITSIVTGLLGITGFSFRDVFYSDKNTKNAKVIQAPVNNKKEKSDQDKKQDNTVTRQVRCPDCSKHNLYGWMPCYKCKSKKKIKCKAKGCKKGFTGYGRDRVMCQTCKTSGLQDCTKCEGKGLIACRRCKSFGGKGYVIRKVFKKKGG